jgi:hypothetical protein
MSFARHRQSQRTKCLLGQWINYYVLTRIHGRRYGNIRLIARIAHPRSLQTEMSMSACLKEKYAALAMQSKNMQSQSLDIQEMT